MADRTLTRDEIAAEGAILRDALRGLEGISEKAMFGGTCFLLDGNMLCGTWKHGGMFRVGRSGEAAALAIPGTRPMTATGRAMTGLVAASPGALEDPDRRGRLLALALDFVGGLPAK